MVKLVLTSYCYVFDVRFNKLCVTTYKWRKKWSWLNLWYCTFILAGGIEEALQNLGQSPESIWIRISWLRSWTASHFFATLSFLFVLHFQVYERDNRTQDKGKHLCLERDSNPRSGLRGHCDYRLWPRWKTIRMVGMPTGLEPGSSQIPIGMLLLEGTCLLLGCVGNPLRETRVVNPRPVYSVTCALHFCNRHTASPCTEKYLRFEFNMLVWFKWIQ